MSTYTYGVAFVSGIDEITTSYTQFYKALLQKRPNRDYILQKRLVILSILLTVATS